MCKTGGIGVSIKQSSVESVDKVENPAGRLVPGLVGQGGRRLAESSRFARWGCCEMFPDARGHHRRYPAHRTPPKAMELPHGSWPTAVKSPTENVQNSIDTGNRIQRLPR